MDHGNSYSNSNWHTYQHLSCNLYQNNYPSHSSLQLDSTLNYPYTNRFVYVNQNFVNTNPSSTVSTKVLINPNFKQTVHINPNFKKPVLMKPKIHINPEILKINKSDKLNSVILKSNVRKLTTVQENKSNPAGFVKNNIVVSTRTKLIRTNDSSAAATNVDSVPKKRRKSIHTKYKIIRSGRNESIKADSNIRKLYYLKNRYKIDKLSPKMKKVVPSKIPKSTYHLYKTATTLVTKNVLIRKKDKTNKSKYISINGILYKKTPNVLRKADFTKSGSCKDVGTGKKGKVLIIRGQVYKLDPNQRTLKLIHSKEDARSKMNWKRIDIGGLTFKQKEPNVYMKSDCNQKRFILSQAKNRSIQILSNKMKKCNLPCPFYRKFGKCRGKENGTCIRVHNPNQIDLCTRFLQGACLEKDCLLSHKVSAEKMPTCKYFLEGLCSREDCSYLHVKISPKADICKDFLEGFCKKATECDKRHQFLCPEYEKTGKCPRKRCSYPHGKVVRKFKFKNKVAKKTTKNMNCKLIKANSRKNNEVAGSVDQIDKNVRYYIGDLKSSNTANDIKDGDLPKVNQLVNSEVVVIADYNVGLTDESVNEPIYKKRVQLGELPSFIPLNEQNDSK